MSSVEGRKNALLIGVNHYYLDVQIGNLEYCVSDVVELNDILSDELRGNYTTRLLHSEMNDIRMEPNRSNIMSMIRLLSNNAGRNDTILLYFAGHGTEENGENYLLPADSRFNVLNETAIPISWIKDSLSRSLASKKFIIIDACHAGLRIGRDLPSSMTESFQEAMLAHAEGMVILSSCRMGEISNDWPEMNHGVFSYYLLDGLRGSADYDDDQIITVSDINRFVYTSVREWADRNETEQNPTMQYEVSGEFILVKVPTEEITDIDSQPVGVDEIFVSEPYDVSDIDDIFNELKFMSSEDIINDKQLISTLDSLIFEEVNIDRLLEKGRHFLRNMFNTRFSSSLVRYYLMPLVIKITNYRDIKKWIENEEAMIEYFILEFINSGSFDYAGTMAHIMNNILPVISDENLLRIIDAIQTNGQISSSFKARTYLINIVDASKTIINREKYSELMTLLS